jgi:hypothetical protein
MSKQEANGRMIGKIGNFGQTLYIKEENGKFWWDIATYATSGTEYWQEIPEYLFVALNLFEDKQEVAMCFTLDKGAQAVDVCDALADQDRADAVADQERADG